MLCGECGTENPDTNKFCKNCGKTLQNQQQPAAQAADTAPVAQPQPSPQNEGARMKSSGGKGMVIVSIVALASGLWSWVELPLLLGILAIVLGIYVIYKSQGTKARRRFIAAAAIIIAAASIFVDFFFLTIFPADPAMVYLGLWLIP